MKSNCFRRDLISLRSKVASSLLHASCSAIVIAIEAAAATVINSM